MDPIPDTVWTSGSVIVDVPAVERADVAELVGIDPVAPTDDIAGETTGRAVTGTSGTSVVTVSAIPGPTSEVPRVAVTLPIAVVPRIRDAVSGDPTAVLGTIGEVTVFDVIAVDGTEIAGSTVVTAITSVVATAVSGTMTALVGRPPEDDTMAVLWVPIPDAIVTDPGTRNVDSPIPVSGSAEAVPIVESATVLLSTVEAIGPAIDDSTGTVAVFEVAPSTIIPVPIDVVRIASMVDVVLAPDTRSDPSAVVGATVAI